MYERSIFKRSDKAGFVYSIGDADGQWEDSTTRKTTEAAVKEEPAKLPPG